LTLKSGTYYANGQTFVINRSSMSSQQLQNIESRYYMAKQTAAMEAQRKLSEKQKAEEIERHRQSAIVRKSELIKEPGGTPYLPPSTVNAGFEATVAANRASADQIIKAEAEKAGTTVSPVVAARLSGELDYRDKPVVSGPAAPSIAPKPYPSEAYYPAYTGPKVSMLYREKKALLEATLPGQKLTLSEAAMRSGQTQGPFVRQVHAPLKVEYGGAMSGELRPEFASAIGFEKLFKRGGKTLAETSYTDPVTGKKIVIKGRSGREVASSVPGVLSFTVAEQKVGEAYKTPGELPIIGETRKEQSVWYGGESLSRGAVETQYQKQIRANLELQGLDEALTNAAKRVNSKKTETKTYTPPETGWDNVMRLGVAPAAPQIAYDLVNYNIKYNVTPTLGNIEEKTYITPDMSDIDAAISMTLPKFKSNIPLWKDVVNPVYDYTADYWRNIEYKRKADLLGAGSESERQLIEIDYNKQMRGLYNPFDLGIREETTEERKGSMWEYVKEMDVPGYTFEPTPATAAAITGGTIGLAAGTGGISGLMGLSVFSYTQRKATEAGVLPVVAFGLGVAAGGITTKAANNITSVSRMFASVAKSKTGAIGVSLPGGVKAGYAKIPGQKAFIVSKGERVLFSSGIKPLNLAKGEGFMPTTTTKVGGELQTALVVSSASKQPAFIGTELTRMKSGLQVMKELQSQASMWVKPFDVKIVENIPPAARQPVMEVITKYEDNFIIKGSSAAATQYKPGLVLRPVKDIDIGTLGGLDPDFLKQEFVAAAKKYNVPVKQEGISVMFKKGGEWVKGLDVMRREELQVEGLKEPEVEGEFRWGLPVKQKPLNIGGKQIQPLSEQVIRKGSTAISPIRLGERYLVNPSDKGKLAVGRIYKDVYDFQESVAPTLIDSAKGSLTTYLRGVKAQQALDVFKSTRGRDITTPIGFGKSLFFGGDNTPKKVLNVLGKVKNSFGKPLKDKKATYDLTSDNVDEWYYANEKAYGKLFKKPRLKSRGYYPYSTQQISRGSKFGVYGKSVVKPIPKSVSLFGVTRQKEYKQSAGYKPNYYTQLKPNEYKPIRPTKSYPIKYPVYNPTAYKPTSSRVYTPQTTYTGYSSTTYKPTYTRSIKTLSTPNIRSVKGNKRIFPPLTKSDEGDTVLGYDVYVKRTQTKTGKGRYINRGYSKANTYPLDEKGAFLLGAETVDKYTNRSFTLRPSKKGAVERTYLPDAVKFYQGRVRRLKGDNRVYVEETKYAIDSAEEKLGIPYESMRLRKKKRASIWG